MIPYPRLPRSIRIAAELAVMFAALVLVDYHVFAGHGFADLQPNPYWIPVIVMAVAYGTGAGLAAAAIASLLWFSTAEGVPGERDYLDHLLHLSIPPLLWLVVGMAIGEVTVVRARRSATMAKRAASDERNRERLTQAFSRLASINRELEVRIAVEDRTVGHAIATAARLIDDDKAVRQATLLHLIAIATRTQNFTCYRLMDDHVQPVLRHPAATQLRVDSLPPALVDAINHRGRVLHVARRSDRVLLEGFGVVAVALALPQHDGVMGCLLLHTLPFDALNASIVAEMQELGEWLGPLMLDAMPIMPALPQVEGMCA